MTDKLTLKESASDFNEDWLLPDAVVMVDAPTTGALLREVQRLRMRLSDEQSRRERAEQTNAKLREALADPPIDICEAVMKKYGLVSGTYVERYRLGLEEIARYHEHQAREWRERLDQIFDRFHEALHEASMDPHHWVDHVEAIGLLAADDDEEAPK